MLKPLEAMKAVATGVGAGLAIIIFAVGLFTSAGFVLAQIGKAMGCAA